MEKYKQRWVKLKRCNLLPVIITVITALAMTLMGCAADSVPSNKEAANAFQALSSSEKEVASIEAAAYSETPAGSGNWTGGDSKTANGGTITTSYKASSDPNALNDWTATGTITFTNWRDQSTGYIINGTLSISLTVTKAILLPSGIILEQKIEIAINGDLTLTGAPISRLTCDYTATIFWAYANMSSISGTITVDGRIFDVAEFAR